MAHRRTHDRCHARPEGGGIRPTFATRCNAPHYEAPGPHVVVGHGETALETFEMTLAEAEEFALGLLGLVRQAEAARADLAAVR
jgi:hypothetical protein